jgi:uncharacterized SAM-binding protein YcdF (DUF218 family)
MKDTHKNAEIIFEYLKLNQNLEGQADLILVFCSSDLRTADFASNLYEKGLGLKIMFSGGPADYKNPLLAKSKFETEAELFAVRAIELGVPENKILVEKESTDLGENIAFSYKLIAKLKLRAEKIIVVQKPYMGRRTFAALKKQWPDQSVKFIIMTENINYQNYIKDMSEPELNYFLNVMVGDFRRIIDYAKPEFNYQIPQTISNEVNEAYLSLVSSGFGSRNIDQPGLKTKKPML